MNNVALLISTHDKSDDLWSPLEKTYLRYWNDISFPIYLTTNQKVFDSQLFHSLNIGNELSWSDNMIKSLLKIDQEYVLLTFDDLFLNSRVNNNLIEELVRHAIDNKFNYLQFYRSISKGRRLNELLFKKLNHTKYKNSTIWSFWKKEILLNILIKEENAWDFERNGNLRSYIYDGFYSTRKNIIPFMNGVVKGKWNPLVRKRLKVMGISTSNDREDLSWLETFRYKLRDLQFDFVTYIIHKIY